ncbi:ParB/RepB/Spo0J family partition protein [Oceanisphaera psychrotolerans]|uniref:Probable chromosome-partitioning protein ParB n=1 Tax=Oceanisphaera psychrotolerans TaxID=1414654 RepID=A0A1J4QHD7_9GAMM|nr:ParB/RepB/Spo0J family partition protein [Oceanisphaera psychrotolerans]OIN13881.1 chromosome partitioning protein ParB [Oceanisphaera psychrotolerans]
MTIKRRGLGKGLDALLSTSSAANLRQHQADVHSQPGANGELQTLALNELQPGKYQPRRDMSQVALEELATSIRQQGIIQPIVVRALESGGYEILAGERRWRAARIAGLSQIPCLIKDVADREAMAIGLIENIQREDLNVIEESRALSRLIDEFGFTHQSVAEAVGKSRSTVSNLLRLAQLNDDVKQLVEHGSLEMGHARALLAISGEQQTELARLVAQKALTVRETESLVKRSLAPKKEKVEQPRSLLMSQLEQEIGEKLGSKVEIRSTHKEKGKLVISYNSLNELDKISHFFGINDNPEI